MDTEGMRIGQLARRVGVTPHLLRAWEKRYGLLRPVRSASGYRVYGSADERRVQAVLALRRLGVPASDAVSRVLNAERLADIESAALTSPASIIARLLLATTEFDEPGVHAALDQAFGLPLEVAVRDVLLPFLGAVGERWADGRLEVAHEHFASGLVRRRLGARTGTWGHGTGPRALLACLPGETHDIGLIAFGLLLARRGWRIAYLGQDTPAADITRTADRLDPQLVVLSAATPQPMAELDHAVDDLTARHVVAFGGAGVDPQRVAGMRAHLLPRDVVEAAMTASNLVRHSRPSP